MATPGGASKRGSHRLSESALCPRKWYLHNALKLVPKHTPDYYMVGTLVHLCLAYHYGERLPVRPAWLKDATLDEALAKTGRGYPELIQQAREIYAAYVEFWAGHDSGWQPFAVEEEFTATLGQIRKLVDPYCEPGPLDAEVLSSRLDLVVKMRGRVWVVDYKTTAGGFNSKRLPTWNPEGDYAVHFQFMLQTAIMKVNFGADFGGVIVERILKKSPFDFDRNVAPIQRRMFLDLPNVLARMCQNERDIAQQMLTAFDAGEDMTQWKPSGNPWQCWGWGHPCEYRPLCIAETDGQEREVREREFRKDTHE